MNKFNKETETNNVWKLFQLIQNEGPISRPDLKKKSGLSWGSVSTMIGKLYDKGFIEKRQRDEKSVGRNPDIWSVSSEEHLCLGIDINVSGLTFVVSDLGWEIHQLIQVGLLSYKKESIIEQLLSTTRDLLSRYKKIMFISISVQGEISQKKDVSVHIDRLENWENVPLKEIFTKEFGIRTFLYHDPDCLMSYHQSEKHFVAKPHSTYLLLKLDDAIGMSLLVFNEIFENHSGAVCEIGKTSFHPEKGAPDTLESMISIAGLCARYAEKKGKEIKPVDCLRLLDKGNPDMVALLQEGASYLALVIRNLSLLFNPRLFILDGKLAKYNKLYEPILDSYLAETCPNKCKFLFSDFKTEACAIGACVLTVNHHLKEVIN